MHEKCTGTKSWGGEGGYVGVSNGPIQFESARKIWLLLELLAKIRCLLACTWSQNFCKYFHARIFFKILCRGA